MRLHHSLLLLVALGWTPSLTRGQDADLAQKARGILKTHCYRCHGENGAVEGGVNYVLDRNQLIARGKLLMKEPVKSRIVRRILLEEMPPDGEKHRPSAADLATLKDWIAAGAPDFNPPVVQRPFITEQAILGTIHADLKTLPDLDRRFVRYFTFTHLYNASLSEDELTTYRQGLSKLINSLSWGKRIVPPIVIDKDRTILRIDLRDYKWSPRTWETLEAHYPYGITRASETERLCQQAMGVQLPSLRGDWFVASAALPPLYHELLALPMTDRALEKELRVNVLANLRDGEAMRAAFNGSGVSRNNRLIERHSSLFGAYWKSYDFASNTDRQNLFASPLGPGVRVTHFKHDGGEIIFSLPNGLHGYMLVDAKGGRLDKGPTEIVSDPRRPDRSVVNGLSCMSCHARGIIVKEDQVRPHVEKNRQAFLKDEVQQVLALYPRRERLQKVMEEDAERFREAVAKTGCLSGSTEPIAALTQRFEAEIDLAHAASELGLPAAQLQKRFEQSVTLARSMGPLAIDGGTVQREVFTEAFASVVKDLELGKALPRAQRGNIWWTAPSRPLGWSPPTVTPLPFTPTPKVTLPDPPVKLKTKRMFASTPSSRFEDPWYYRVSSHPTGQLNAVAISPRDRQLVALEATIGIITLFHRGDGNNWASMSGHKGNIFALDFAPDGNLLASGSLDQTAKLWDADTGKEQYSLSGHAGFVRAVKFSPDGQWLATGSERVRLWNVRTGAEILSFAKTPTWIDSLAFSHDGKLIASASNVVQIWDASTGKLVQELGDAQTPAHAVAFSPDGKLLAWGTSNGTIHLWDQGACKTHSVLKGHRQPIRSLAFNVNGKLLVSATNTSAGTEPGEFKAWDPHTGAVLLEQTGHASGISCVAVAPDGRLAVTAGLDGHLRVRDLMSLNKVPLGPFEGHPRGISCVVLAADGKLVVTGGSDHTARLWDAKTGAQLHRFDGHTAPVHTVLLSADNKFAYSYAGDKTLRQWNLATGKESKRWNLSHPLIHVSLNTVGNLQAVAVDANGVLVVDLITGAKSKSFKGPDRFLALSPDGRRVAGSIMQKGTRIWDVASGDEIASIGPAKANFAVARFSPDGKHLLTGAYDHSVCLWDTESGREVARYKGCTKRIHDVSFADDGRQVIATCGDSKATVGGGRQEYVGCAVFLWDRAGQELRRWDAQPSIVGRLAISSQDRSALFVTRDGVKRVELP